MGDGGAEVKAKVPQANLWIFLKEKKVCVCMEGGGGRACVCVCV